MRNWLANFMYGRYGLDNLSKFLMIMWFSLAAVNIFFRSPYIYAVSLIPAFFFFFRVLSRNYARRSAENAKYLSIVNKTGAWFRFRLQKLREIGTHRYRKCPGCRAMLRLPRRTGKHTAVCPRCSRRFEVKIII
jgi:hypothetical protein